MTSKGLIAEVFWSHVHKQGDGCWRWTGSVVKTQQTHNPYGKYGARGMAHRVSYEILVGPIPNGLELDHLCRFTLCVNPAHLEPVTKAENMRRRSLARTHCVNGHLLTPENTVDSESYIGRRACLTCSRAKSLAYYYRKRRNPNYQEDLERRNHECRNRHPRTDDNTYVSPSGQRYCKTCRRERDEKARQSETMKRQPINRKA